MPISTIVKLLQEAKHVVIFTGAGVSAESGIPTFRDALTGLWDRFEPGQLATAEAFRADSVCSWFLSFYGGAPEPTFVSTIFVF